MQPLRHNSKAGGTAVFGKKTKAGGHINNRRKSSAGTSIALSVLLCLRANWHGMATGVRTMLPRWFERQESICLQSYVRCPRRKIVRVCVFIFGRNFPFKHVRGFKATMPNIGPWISVLGGLCLHGPAGVIRLTRASNAHLFDI